MYALSDEQALLAKLRYNNLIGIFTQLTCYSLQNHLRTSIPIWNPMHKKNDSSQVETDELYVGIDKQGVHYAIPVEAKSINDTLSVIQIWQNHEVCRTKFSNMPIRCIAAQTISGSGLAPFEIQANEPDNVAIVDEKHYELVPPEEVTEADLERYRHSLKD